MDRKEEVVRAAERNSAAVAVVAALEALTAKQAAAAEDVPERAAQDVPEVGVEDVPEAATQCKAEAAIECKAEVAIVDALGLAAERARDGSPAEMRPAKLQSLPTPRAAAKEAAEALSTGQMRTAKKRHIDL